MSFRVSVSCTSSRRFRRITAEEFIREVDEVTGSVLFLETGWSPAGLPAKAWSAGMPNSRGLAEAAHDLRRDRGAGRRTRRLPARVSRGGTCSSAGEADSPGGPHIQGPVDGPAARPRASRADTSHFKAWGSQVTITGQPSRKGRCDTATSPRSLDPWISRPSSRRPRWPRSSGGPGGGAGNRRPPRSSSMGRKASRKWGTASTSAESGRSMARNSTSSSRRACALTTTCWTSPAARCGPASTSSPTSSPATTWGSTRKRT